MNPHFFFSSTLLGTGVMIAGLSFNSGGVFLGGLAVATAGPSFGHVYGRGQLFTYGLGARVVGVGMMTYGLVEAIGEVFSTEEDHSSSAGALLGGGAILFLGGAIYDIATAGTATARANEARRARVGPF